MKPDNAVPFTPGEKVHDVRTNKSLWVVAPARIRIRMPGSSPDTDIDGYLVSDRWGTDLYVAGCLLATGHRQPSRWWLLPFFVFSFLAARLAFRLLG